jgi:hypothetical protein
MSGIVAYGRSGVEQAVGISVEGWSPHFINGKTAFPVISRRMAQMSDISQSKTDISQSKTQPYNWLVLTLLVLSAGLMAIELNYLLEIVRMPGERPPPSL